MLKSKLFGLVMMVVLVVGAAPNLTTAQQTTKEKADKLWEKFLATEPEKKWKTFYSPEYRFSINYPSDNFTTISITNDDGFKIDSKSDMVNFVVKVNPIKIGAQEFMVRYTQYVPEHFTILEGNKVSPITQDGVVGYMIQAINHQNGAWNYVMDFDHKGYSYFFIFEVPFTTEDINNADNMINSIKFFD